MGGKRLQVAGRYLSVAILLLGVSLVSAVASASSQTPAMERGDKLHIEGQWRQGAMLTGYVAPGSQIKFLDHDVKVAADGLFVIGLGRDAKSPARLLVRSSDGREQDYTFTVEQRQYNIQRVEGVPNKTVNPSAEQVARSRKEAALAWRARQLNSDRRDFQHRFKWPLLGPISGVYGSQRFYNGEARRPHYGVDVAAPTGTLVRAPAAGVVTLVHDDMFFSGGTLIVDHGHGVSSSFIHLSKILVAEGDEVAQGQSIAEVGATGRATGPHLDWRMNWFDQRLDPQLLVGDMPPQ